MACFTVSYFLGDFVPDRTGFQCHPSKVYCGGGEADSSRSRCQNIIDLDRQVMMSLKKPFSSAQMCNAVCSSGHALLRFQASYFFIPRQLTIYEGATCYIE